MSGDQDAEEGDQDARDRHRMDFTGKLFTFTKVNRDDERNLEIEGIELGVLYRPHPDRYDRIDNPPGWLDKFDKSIIPDSELAEWEADVDEDVPYYHLPTDIPRYSDPHEVGNIEEYIDARKEEIEKVLSGEVPVRLVEPDRAELARLRQEGVTDFIIISIDIVDSTALMTYMDRDRYLKMMHVYQKEITRLMQRFHASVLSVSGDGIIAFLPGPNVSGMHDNAIDCASSIRYLMANAVNEMLGSYGYPRLRYRIGLDTGSPEIVRQGEEGHNLIGSAVSLAKKIQEAADPGEILLGDVTERNLHTRWRQNTELVTDEKDWEYEIGGELYDIYRYNQED